LSLSYNALQIFTRSTDALIATDFFSRDLLGYDYRGNPDAVDQLLIKNYMNSVDSHFEIKSDQKGCLTVNGLDE